MVVSTERTLCLVQVFRIYLSLSIPSPLPNSVKYRTKQNMLLLKSYCGNIMVYSKRTIPPKGNIMAYSIKHRKT